MSETFNNLEGEKQQRILNAALQEFAEHGFDQASTNRIVKKAGIGKGMLFYYFKNKQELYRYLVKYSLDVTINRYIKKINEEERDFIERFKHASKMKMQAFADHPHVFYFMGALLLSDKDQLPKELHDEILKLQTLGNSILYEDIDYSFFRTDIDVDKAFKLIRWSMEGYQNELLNKLKGKPFTSVDMEPYWEEFDEYLEILKTSFYK
ncbi:TetR/AcrR family transcriptional regulator [Thalassorhabdus alkalitolerans]|uniref:TetR/AcrR family transcriptional regulator n=1 Tax=Thalassorhabdus alkalitolerans TaxID=2282697 RepID=A0ABW0YKM7_9BACI